MGSDGEDSIGRMPIPLTEAPTSVRQLFKVSRDAGGHGLFAVTAFEDGHDAFVTLLAGQSPDVLAANFGVDASVFDKFPKKDVFMTK